MLPKAAIEKRAPQNYGFVTMAPMWLNYVWQGWLIIRCFCMEVKT